MPSEEDGSGPADHPDSLQQDLRHQKVLELTKLLGEMNHLLTGSDVHSVFLDEELQILRYSSKAAEILGLGTQHIGRSIRESVEQLDEEGLFEELQSVLRTNVPYEKRLRDRLGQNFLLRVLPSLEQGESAGIILTLIDIESLVEAQQDVGRVRERFERAIAANRDGIWDWPDLTDDRMWWSPRCWELLGYEMEELEPLHSTWMKLIHPEDRTRIEQTSVPTQQECYVEAHQDFEYRMLHRSGEYLWFRHRAMVDRDESGRPLRMTGSVGNINDRKNVELQNIEATQAILRRDQFLAMLSHELRNPISAVLNSVEYMMTVHQRSDDASAARDEKPSLESVVDALKIIQKQSEHMGRLLDDLLDISRFGNEKIEFRFQSCDLVELHADVIAAVKHHFDKKDQTLRINVPDHAVMIHADPARIKQAQVNLLSNASKYTEDGGEIWYSISANSRTTQIEVKDTGVGVPQPLQKQIFDLFVQSETSLARSSGGIGVGLSLARQILDAHDGEIKVQSEGHGKGSTFTISLPISSMDKRLGENSITGANHHWQARRILIVEDNVDAGEMLAKTLRLKGYEVFVAHEAMRAIELFSQFTPDIAVVDIGLPEIDGYELARRLRVQEKQKTLLIAVTGYGRNADQKRAAEAGFDSHFVKPLDPTAFFQSLQAPIDVN